jgi:hypothetical protein
MSALSIIVLLIIWLIKNRKKWLAAELDLNFISGSYGFFLHWQTEEKQWWKKINFLNIS